MSDDPKSMAPRRQPPAYDSPLHPTDAQPLEVPAEAYASEEDQQAPEQEVQPQDDEAAYSYEETPHSTDAQDEPSQQAEEEGTYEAQEPDEARQPAAEEQPSYEEVPPPHDPAPVAGVKSIAPRHTARPAQRRMASVQEKDPDSQILALSHQLQELIAQKHSGPGGGGVEENQPSASATPKARRVTFKPHGPPAALRNPALQVPPNPQPPTPLKPALTTPPAGSPRPGMDWPMRLAVGLLGVCLLAGVFVAGRATSSVGLKAGKPPQGEAAPYVPSISTLWSEPMISQLDAILTADLGGDVEQAYRLTTDLRATAKFPVPGLNAYLANLETRRGNYHEAESLLGSAFDQGVLSANNQFAFNYTRQRDFAKASQRFSRAVMENPFSADDFYRLGETLRRQGNLQDAMKRLKEALVRLPAEPMFDTQREWMALKLRLAQIEAGQSADLQPDIDAHLQVSPPSGYWALTAAAAALQGGDLLAAAVALDKAKAALPSEQFKALMSDYFFRAYAGSDRMAPYFANDPTAVQRKQKSRTAYFIDP